MREDVLMKVSNSWGGKMDVSIAVSAKGFPLRFPCYQRQVGIDERERDRER